MENTYRRARALAQAKAYEMVDSDPRFNESWFGRLTRILGSVPLCPGRRRGDNMCEPCPCVSPASSRWVLMRLTKRSFKEVLAEMPDIQDDDMFDAR
jgi:hypothetical protein